jgi:hypothetical protein
VAHDLLDQHEPADSMIEDYRRMVIDDGPGGT